MKVFSAQFYHRKVYSNLVCNFFYPAISNEHITVENAAFVNDLYILYQVILHILDQIRNYLIMQFIKTVARLVIILILPTLAFSQSTYLPQGSQFEHFLDRIGIKMQTNPDLNIFTCKPISRKVAVEVTEQADSLSAIYPSGEAYHLGRTDQDNAQSILTNNSEWVSGSQESFQSKHPVWNS